jgi:hypothetical protein
MNLEIDKLMERNELIGYFSISNNKTIDVGCVSLEDRKKFFKKVVYFVIFIVFLNYVVVYMTQVFCQLYHKTRNRKLKNY